MTCQWSLNECCTVCNGINSNSSNQSLPAQSKLKNSEKPTEVCLILDRFSVLQHAYSIEHQSLVIL